MTATRAAQGPRSEAREAMVALLDTGFRVETLQGTKKAVVAALKKHAGSSVEGREVAEKLVAYVQRYGIKSLRAAAPKITDTPEQPWHALAAGESRRGQVAPKAK